MQFRLLGGLLPDNPVLQELKTTANSRFLHVFGQGT